MSKPSSNPLLFIGKPVKDEYGRQIGQIVSFIVSPNGRVDNIFVKHGDGEFSRYPSEHFKTLDDSMLLLPPLKLKVKSLCDEIPLIWRKDQALAEIMETKKFPTDMVDSFHKNFEGALNQLKVEAKETIDEIDREINDCDKQIKDLNSALVNLEIERGIGRLDDKSYQTSMIMIQEGLKQASSEKTDLQIMRNTLSNMLLGEKPAAETEVKSQKESTPVPTTSLPEPPVVVHVKTVSKTSP
jgi:archaellum component FlaC